MATFLAPQPIFFLSWPCHTATHRKTVITDFDIFVTLQQGDPIEERYKESVNRGAVIDQLVRCVNSYREAAVSNDPRFDHIDISEKEKVISVLISNTHVLTEN